MTTIKRAAKHTFSSYRSIAAIEPPTDKDFVEAWHESVAGFGVRVMRKDHEGKSRKTYLCRYPEQVSDGAGGYKNKDRKERIGLVDEFGDEPATPFADAMEYALSKRRMLKSKLSAGGAKRMTVGDAWARYASEKQLNRPATNEKDAGVYERNLAHLADKFLDELDYDYWSSVVSELKAGTYQTGTEIKNGKTVPILRGPLARASIFAVLNVASNLYELARKSKGLRNYTELDYNPTKHAKKLIGKSNVRKTYITLSKLGKAWRASEALITPAFRDLFQFIVLTGMRRALVLDMSFNEIDFDNKLFVIDPHKRGTKRRGADLQEKAEAIKLPLSDAAMQILKRRREFAPDKAGKIWYSAPKKGKAAEGGVITNPRTSWEPLEAVLGFHFTPHDLRRTFATVGSVAVAGSNLVSLSRLMLHTSASHATVAGIPTTTVKYISDDEALAGMRSTANAIADYIQQLVDDNVSNFVEPTLPAAIERELRTE